MDGDDAYDAYDAYDNYMKSLVGRPMSLREAFEVQDTISKMPTGTARNYEWVDAKTKQPVNFGRNDQPGKF